MTDPSPSGASTSGGTALQRPVIEYILDLPFIDKNNVQLLRSGRDTFQTIVDLIESARHIICIEFYIFKDDETGKKLAELLKEKARRGINVYLLYDHFGSFLTSRRFWSDLKKAGIRVRISNPFKWSAPRGYIYRNHKKLMIIDGVKAITGGFNIADEYHSHLGKKTKTWRDTGIVLEGPVVSALLNIFRKSWSTWKGERIMCSTESRLFERGVPVIPVFANSGRARRKMRRLLIYSIKNARESILLTTAYFIPSKRVIRALIGAVSKGVNIKLLLPAQSDVLPVFYAGRNYYEQLLKAGVEIYNYEGSVLHAKTIVFDGCWSIIGSANLDLQSWRRNDESNVGVLDRDFSMCMTETFQKDLQNSFRVDPVSWVKRPLFRRVLEKFFYRVMRKL